MKILILVSLLIIALSCSRPSENGPNDLPPLRITLVNGDTIDAKSLNGQTVLILFNPECDHCQHQAEDIRENLDLFEDYSVCFLSSGPIDQLRQFAMAYGLDQAPHVSFGSVPSEPVLDFYGPVPVPSIYVYDENGKLSASFEGQVGINELIDAL